MAEDACLCRCSDAKVALFADDLGDATDADEEYDREEEANMAEHGFKERSMIVGVVRRSFIGKKRVIEMSRMVREQGRICLLNVLTSGTMRRVDSTKSKCKGRSQFCPARFRGADLPVEVLIDVVARRDTRSSSDGVEGGEASRRKRRRGASSEVKTETEAQCYA